VDHLLFHYEIVTTLWSAIFSCVVLAWVVPKRVVETFLPIGEGWEAFKA
jgi:hypothetical protein